MTKSPANSTVNRYRHVATIGALLLIPLMSLTGSAAEIVAHRGASYDAPENTLASMQLAWKQNADAVEIDVYLTKDGKIVLMHDKTPKRYGGPDRNVESMTWEELRTLDVGAWKDKKFTGVTPPLLEDALKHVPEGKRLFIEIKSGPQIVPELKRVLKQANLKPEQTAIICFSQAVIESTVKELPHLQSYWVLSMQDKNKETVTKEWVIATARKIGTHGVDVGGKTSLISEDFVKSIQAAGIPVFVWTVNDPAEAKRLAEIGVQSITTDRPGLLKENGIGEIAVPQLVIESKAAAE